MLTEWRKTGWFPLCAPFCAAIIALVPYLVSTFGDPVFGLVTCDYVVTPFSAIVLLIFAVTNRNRRVSFLCMIAVVCVVSWISSRKYFEFRPAFRWMLYSKRYQAEVLAEPNSTKGDFRHVEWDGWGFAGVGDTVVYVVHDPEDSLSRAAQSHSSGKYKGVPCGVAGVFRLERNWYSLTLYTETDWDQCLQGRE